MQRLCALVLVSWVSISLTLPGFLSRTADPLPECCRRTGRHKCAMQIGALQTTDPAGVPERAIKSHCPFAKVTRAEAVLPSLWLPAPAQVSFAELLSHPAVRPQTESRFRISFLRAWQKRGPPSSLLA